MAIDSMEGAKTSAADLPAAYMSCLFLLVSNLLAPVVAGVFVLVWPNVKLVLSFSSPSISSLFSCLLATRGDFGFSMVLFVLDFLLAKFNFFELPLCLFFLVSLMDSLVSSSLSNSSALIQAFDSPP